MEDQIEKFFSIIILFLFLIVTLVVAPKFSTSLVTVIEEEEPPIPPGDTTMFKTSPWNENCTIDEYGRIYLNDTEFKVVALHLKHGVTNPSLSIARGMISDLADAGMRFMVINFPYWFSYSDMTTDIQFWFPILHEYHMWVIVQVQHDCVEEPPVLSVAVQLPKHEHIIDKIDDNSSWVDMVVSWNSAWELDAAEFDFTDSEVETFLKDMTPDVQAALRASGIGDVPIVNKPQNPYDNNRGGYGMGMYANLTGLDYYFSVSGDDSGLWSGICETRMDEFYNVYMPAVGKTGYYVWHQEFGIQNFDLNYEFTGDLLDEAINNLSENRVSVLCIWNMWNYVETGQGVWSAFAPDGTMNSWFSDLVSTIQGLN